MDLMKRDIQIIRNNLNCNAVRIFGCEIDRLMECTKIALDSGLQAWVSPRLIDADEEETFEIRTRSGAGFVERKNDHCTSGSFRRRHFLHVESRGRILARELQLQTHDRQSREGRILRGD